LLSFFRRHGSSDPRAVIVCLFHNCFQIMVYCVWHVGVSWTCSCFAPWILRPVWLLCDPWECLLEHLLGFPESVRPEPSIPGDWCGLVFCLSELFCYATVFCSLRRRVFGGAPVRCLVVVCPAGVSLETPSGFSPRACALTFRPRGVVG